MSPPAPPSKTSAGTTVTVRFAKNSADAETPPRFAIAYWSIRGLGAPLRMMLCAAKADHTVLLYDLVEDGEGGYTSDYFKDKQNLIEELRAPLMNLPYVVDRTGPRRVICQTNACFAYLARELGFWGSNEAEASQCEELLCEIYDLRNVIIKFSYGGDGSKGAAEVAMKGALKSLKKLNACLKLEREGKTDAVHLVGGKMTAPDFHLFEMLDQYVGLCRCYGLSDFLEDFHNLKAFKAGFEKLEHNQFYLKSWLHTDLPFNNCIACFGGFPGPEVYKHGESAKNATWRGKGEVTLSSD